MNALSCPICLCSRVPVEYLEHVSTTDRECFAALGCGHVAHEACLLMVRRPPEPKRGNQKPKINKACPCCKAVSSKIFRLYLQRSDGASSSSPVRPRSAQTAINLANDGEEEDDEDTDVEEDAEAARRRLISELRATIADLKQQQTESSQREERSARDISDLRNTISSLKHRVGELQEQSKLAQRQQAKFDDLRKKLGEKDKQIQELRQSKLSKEQAAVKSKEETRVARAELANAIKEHNKELQRVYEDRNEIHSRLDSLKSDNVRLRGAMDSWRLKYEDVVGARSASRPIAPETLFGSRKRKSDDAALPPTTEEPASKRTVDLSVGGLRVKDRTIQPPSAVPSKALADAGLWDGEDEENDESVLLMKNPSPRQPPASQNKVIIISSDSAGEEEEEEVKTSRGNSVIASKRSKAMVYPTSKPTTAPTRKQSNLSSFGIKLDGSKPLVTGPSIKRKIR